MSAPTFMRLEHGQSCHRPTLNAVAVGYGVPLHWLLGEPDREVDLQIALRRLDDSERLNLYCSARSRAALGLTLIFRPEERESLKRVAERTRMGTPLLRKLASGEHSPQLGRVLEALAEELPPKWVTWGVVAWDEERARHIQDLAADACFKKIGLTPLSE